MDGPDDWRHAILLPAAAIAERRAACVDEYRGADNRDQRQRHGSGGGNDLSIPGSHLERRHIDGQHICDGDCTTLFVLPGAPAGLALSTASSTSIGITWNAPTVGTSPFTYLLQWSPHGANTWSSTNATVSGLSGQVTNLTAGTAYDFRVTASNPAGAGPASATFSASTTPATLAVTWAKPASSPMTFSADLLTATAGGSATVGAQPQSCVSTTSITLGKVSFEVTMAALTQNAGIGLCNASWINGTSGGLGINAFGIKYDPTTGQNSRPALTAYYNGAAILAPTGTPAGDVAGATITGCLDRTLGQVWYTSPAMRAAFGPDAWNDSATANPATGAGGIEIGQVITPGVGTITGPDGTQWTVTADGHVAVNGAPDGTTTGVSQMVAIGGVIWQENSGGNWYFKHIPSDIWSTPTTTAPAYLIGPLFLCFDTAEAGAVAVFNPGSSAYTYAVPSTFPAWNGNPASFTAPGQVTGLAAGTPTTTSVPLTWTALTVGTQPFTYSVQWSPQGANNWTTFGTTQGISLTVTGLNPATAYSFQVIANNVTGTPGPASSPSINATTAAAPSTKSITIDTIPTQTVGVAFTITGSLDGYPTPPTLQYEDNASGTWLPFPSGSEVSASAFSFVHPAISVTETAATVTVRDTG